MSCDTCEHQRTLSHCTLLVCPYVLNLQRMHSLSLSSWLSFSHCYAPYLISHSLQTRATHLYKIQHYDQASEQRVLLQHI